MQVRVCLKLVLGGLVVINRGRVTILIPGGAHSSLVDYLAQVIYRTRAIITRSRFETALDYKPRIFKVRKVSM